MKININWTIMEILEVIRKKFYTKNKSKIDYTIAKINHFLELQTDDILLSSLKSLEFEKYFNKDNKIYDEVSDINNINEKESIELLDNITEFVEVLYIRSIQ